MLDRLIGPPCPRLRPLPLSILAPSAELCPILTFDHSILLTATMEDEEPAAAAGGASLPGYSLLPQSSSSDAAPAFQFDIVPRSDASSFQAGYQGLQERGFQVWIRGDVLLKSSPQAMTRCSIRLVAEETAESRSLTLHDASQVLWTSPTQPTTSSAPAYDAQPPSMMPFEFSLPQHLPHCLHLPDIKLEYRLVATLEGVDQPQSKTVAVHVTRYSAPGPLKQLLPSSSQQRFSDEAKVWKRTTPTDIDVTLARTLLRRGDHIPLRIQVAAPHDKLIAKGLRIRSVEAELVRTIEARPPQPEAASTSNSKARQKDGEGVWEPHEHLLESDSPSDTTPPPSSSSAAPTRHRTVLAYSGKACRFSLSRPLVLHLTLVPPFTSPALPHPSPDHDAPPAGLSPLTAGSAGGGGGCESITQQTALSSVSFAVKVYIRMRGPSASGAAANATATTTAPGSSSASPSAPTENQDVVLESDVYILPALAGAGDVEAEVGAESETPNEAPAPNGVSWPTDEEEFDGYEDFQDSREVFEEEEQAAAAIAASQPRIDVNGDPSITGSTAAAAAVRRPSYHPSGADEPPPTVQQSQHDLQIFPSGSAGHGGDDDAFPPPHSERQDVNEVPSYDEGESEPTGATMPPAWTARTTEPIDGVGEGERRYPPHHHHGVQASNGLTRPAQGSYEAPPPLTSPPPEFDDANHTQQQPFALPSEQQTHLHLERSSSMQQGTQELHRRQRGTSAVEPPPYMTMMAAGHGASSPPPPPSSPPPALTSPSSPPPPPPLSPGAYYSSAHEEAGGSSTPLATTSRAPATNGNSNGAPSASSSTSYPTAAEEKEALALSMAMADTSVATGPAEEGSSQSGGDQDEFVDAQEGVVDGSEEGEHGDGVDDELPPGYEA